MSGYQGPPHPFAGYPQASPGGFPQVSPAGPLLSLASGNNPQYYQQVSNR